MPARLPSRLELLDPHGYQPRLNLSPELSVPPQAGAADRRPQVVATWQALQATPEDVVRDRLELDKLDRGIVAVRRQMHAARADAAAAQAKAARLEHERFGPVAVWGIAGVALAAGFGWLHQRRRLLALQREDEVVHFHRLAADPVAFPPAVQPRGQSDFDNTEVEGDAADRWVEQPQLALPAR